MKMVGSYGSPAADHGKTQGLLLTTGQPQQTSYKPGSTSTPLPPISEPRGSASPEKFVASSIRPPAPPFGKSADDYYTQQQEFMVPEPYTNRTQDTQHTTTAGSSSEPSPDHEPVSVFVGLGLHVCCVTQNMEVAELMLEATADIFMTDDFGRTALHIAAQYGSEGVLGLLLDHHDDSSELVEMRDNDNRSALYTAAFYKHVGCVNALYDYFAPDNLSPRTMTHTEPIINVVRYEERRQIFDPPRQEAGLVGLRSWDSTVGIVKIIIWCWCLVLFQLL